MFLKQLTIASPTKGLIRKIDFHIGLNLIVDQTPMSGETLTGNSVGKTTVLALIDYCLGGDVEMIYRDVETKKDILLVKNFLEDNEVIITLVLKKNLEEVDSCEVHIERNFLKRNKRIMKINGDNYTARSGKEFQEQLDIAIWGDRKTTKPSFRQLISHNIRYRDIAINNTLKCLNSYSTGIEYETLYLYMFGLPIYQDRAVLAKSLQIEKTYKDRLERSHKKTELELQLNIVEDQISELTRRKDRLNINSQYEEDLNTLNSIKYQISRLSTNITEDELKRDLILETKRELEQDMSQIDLFALKEIYSVAQANISAIHKTFEEIINYHNHMIIERVRFLTQDLPSFEDVIHANKNRLSQLIMVEKSLAKKISSSNTFTDLENIMKDLNDNFHRKGELEITISQIKSAETQINKMNVELEVADEGVFTEKFKSALFEQLRKFNRYFAGIANKLYNERYGISFEVREDKAKTKYYHFDCFNDNTSSGKKQGEIICFDIAYILFARQEGLPTLDFLINDKKELMHGNQLLKTRDCVEEEKIQAVFSILSDKLPSELCTDAYTVLNLSQSDKLFRIEEMTNKN